MKNKFLSVLFLLQLFSMCTSGQELDPPVNRTPQQSHDYFMKKSRNNRTAGWVLVGTGSALYIGGALSISQLDIDAASTLVVLVVACCLASIPFFKIGSRNKKKAKLALSNQPVSYGCYRMQKMSYPSVGLQINF